MTFLLLVQVFDREVGIIEPVLTILAAVALTSVGTGNATLETLAVLFEASRFLTVAALRMNTLIWLNFRFECIRIALQNFLHCGLSFFIAFLVDTILAIAVRSAPCPISEALAIEFEAF